jgi:hypothetical protein
MCDASTWHPVFSTTLATFAVLESQFRSDLTGFTAAKLAQKRLLSVDLGLAPATLARVQKIIPTPKRKNRFAND